MYKEGQNAYFEIKGMWVQVKILEIKQAYGRTRYKVAPIAGKRTAIVEKLKDKISK